MGIMLFSEPFFWLLVQGALLLSAVGVVLLVVFLILDIKNRRVW